MLTCFIVASKHLWKNCPLTDVKILMEDFLLIWNRLLWEAAGIYQRLCVCRALFWHWERTPVREQSPPSEFLSRMVRPYCQLRCLLETCHLLVCLVPLKPCFIFGLKMSCSCASLVPRDCSVLGFRLQVKSLLTLWGGPEEAGIQWEWTGWWARGESPPQMLASTEGARGPGIPKVIKILNSCHGSCVFAKVCCCYVFAALTTRILQIVPFVIINCLWSSMMWAAAVYRTTWTTRPTPQRNTRFTVFQALSCKTTWYVSLFGRKGEEKGHLPT